MKKQVCIALCQKDLKRKAEFNLIEVEAAIEKKKKENNLDDSCIAISEYKKWVKKQRPTTEDGIIAQSKYQALEKIITDEDFLAGKSVVIKDKSYWNYCENTNCNVCGCIKEYRIWYEVYIDEMPEE